MLISIPPDWILIAQLLLLVVALVGLLKKAFGSIRIKIGAACDADLSKMGKLTLKIEVTWGESPQLIYPIFRMPTMSEFGLLELTNHK
jgi:hypothetical protein